MAALLGPSTLPGERKALRLLALPQIRVETLIGSQANYEKNSNNDILLQDNDIL